MKFSVVTLFPELITAYCTTSIVGRGQTAGAITVETINPRDFTTDVHHKVDDSPYGGGSGMVMMLEPLEKAVQSLLPLLPQARVLMMTPTGCPFNHTMARQLADNDQVVLICGHYEGVDARLYPLLQQQYGIMLEDVSIGDYVLTGGELAALAIIDATSRQIPGVVQKFTSVQADSFYNGLLDHPHYTRPATYKGLAVPDVLLSGNHSEIDRWRQEQALALTKRNRPDLLQHRAVLGHDERA